MAKKKVTRKELLKETDEFLSLSSRTANFVREHSSQFSYLGMALAAALLLYLGINTFLGYVNKKGQEAYNRAYYGLARNTDPESMKQDLNRSVEGFQEVINKYGLSKAKRLAMPELAYLKLLEKKYDEAISLYQKFLDEAPDNSPYQSLARMAIAACYEGKGELHSAIETLNQILAGPDDLLKEQAMLSLARIYRLTNQEDKSKEILRKFIKKFETSPYLSIAKAHLNN